MYPAIYLITKYLHSLSAFFSSIFVRFDFRPDKCFPLSTDLFRAGLECPNNSQSAIFPKIPVVVIIVIVVHVDFE